MAGNRREYFLVFRSWKKFSIFLCFCTLGLLPISYCKQMKKFTRYSVLNINWKHLAFLYPVFKSSVVHLGHLLFPLNTKSVTNIYKEHINLLYESYFCASNFLIVLLKIVYIIIVTLVVNNLVSMSLLISSII